MYWHIGTGTDTRTGTGTETGLPQIGPNLTLRVTGMASYRNKQELQLYCFEVQAIFKQLISNASVGLIMQFRAAERTLR
jgi:hypothetical protein